MVTLSLQCENQILGSSTATNVAITMLVTESECGQTQTKTYGEWTNHACGLYAPDSFMSVIQMQVLS